MKTNCYAIKNDGHLAPLQEKAALEAWRAGSDPIWIDLEGADQEYISTWLDRLGLDQDLLDLLHTGGLITKILPMAQAVFFEYPVVSDQGLEHPVNFFCMCFEGLVVTAQDQMADSPAGAELKVEKIKLPVPTTSGLVCALIIIQSMRLRRLVMEMRDQARVLGERMDTDPDSVPLEDILSLKKGVMQLDGAVDEELAVFDLLQNINYPALDLASLGDYFQIAMSNTRASDRSIDCLERSVLDLQGRFDSLQQDKTNSRLGVLTIISAIFMPLTLMAGLYGMNFDNMPELHFHYGYFYALGAMAVTAGALYWYFRSRGWLK